jgi:hypothetical protein
MSAASEGLQDLVQEILDAIPQETAEQQHSNFSTGARRVLFAKARTQDTELLAEERTV